MRSPRRCTRRRSAGCVPSRMTCGGRRSVRQRGILAHLHAGTALEPELLVRLRDEPREIGSASSRPSARSTPPRTPSSVTSDARRMSSSSCASFTMRQPAVTGVPLVTASAGAALRDPVAEHEAHGLLDADAPVRDARGPSVPAPPARRDPRPPPTRAPRRRPAGRAASCSRARSSSNAGETTNGVPRCGMTTASRRSLRPQRMLVK